MKREQKQMVELEEFEQVCRERNAYKEDSEIYRKQARNLDETCKKLRKENEDLLAGIIQHTKHAGELEKERNGLQRELSIAKRANDSFMVEIKQLKAQATEAHGQFQKRVKELGDGLDASAALLQTAQDERDVARQEADYLRKRCQEAEERAVGFQTHLTTQEEVIERLKAQNARFVEEQREAKQRAASLAADNARAREEVARLVRQADAFKAQNDHLAARLAKVTQEKNQIQAEYDARGKVIKKLRKRLHKLKKKLKH